MPISNRILHYVQNGKAGFFRLGHQNDIVGFFTTFLSDRVGFFRLHFLRITGISALYIVTKV